MEKKSTFSILEIVQKNGKNSVIRKFRTTAFDGYLAWLAPAYPYISAQSIPQFHRVSYPKAFG